MLLYFLIKSYNYYTEASSISLLRIIKSRRENAFLSSVVAKIFANAVSLIFVYNSLRESGTTSASNARERSFDLSYPVYLGDYNSMQARFGSRTS